jgi:nitroreductase
MLKQTGGGSAAAWLGPGLATLQLLSPEDVAAVIIDVAGDEHLAGEVLCIDNSAEPGSGPQVSRAAFTDASPRIFGASPRQSEPLSAEEVIYTTRAMRRLKPDQVPTELLARIIEAATMGPSGNAQENWRFFVITDRERISDLAALLATIYERLRGHTSHMPEALLKSCEFLIEHFADVPAVVLSGAVDFPGPDSSLMATTTWYASIVPSVQNLMLAARAAGLGTTLTTLPLVAHDALRAIAGVPDDVTLVACNPVGWPKGRFARPERQSSDRVAWLDGEPMPLPAATGHLGWR